MSIINNPSRLYCDNKINEVGNSFLKLAKIIKNNNIEDLKKQNIDIDIVFENISDRMCKECERCFICWEDNCEETYGTIRTMLYIGIDKGYLPKDSVPKKFLEDCLFSDQYIFEVNKRLELEQVHIYWSNKLRENQIIVTDQLKEASNIMRSLSYRISKEKKIIDINEALIIKQLKKRGIILKNIMLVDNKKRKELIVTASCKKGCISIKNFAKILSDILKLKVIPSEASRTVITKEIDEFIFYEETKYKILTGIARGIKDKISGDNFSIMKIDEGETLIVLSDGMGTGTLASKESDLAISLLEEFLEAGFNISSAIRLINSSLITRSMEQSFTTMDVVLINLYNGISKFIKIGASTAFIKRKDKVEAIQSTTMPIGIINEIDFEISKKRLYDGDVIIMITDGVLDSIVEENKEKVLIDIIKNINSHNPKEISNTILEKILKNNNYAIIDDMTIITAVIWKKV